MSYYTATSEALTLGSHRLRRPAQEFKPHRTYHGKKRPHRDPSDAKTQVSQSKTSEKRNRLSTPKKRKQVVYVKAISNVKFFSWRLLITLFAIFFGMVATAASSAVLRKSHSELNSMRRELVLMQDDEAMLKAKISEEYDITQIERIATMRLNMSKPKAHQIVYIHLPKQDYVVHHGTQDYDTEPAGVLEIIAGLLNSAKMTLYSVVGG